ncbi:MAG TPA: Uma2 family endonuclease [Bacteroidetes bacterium]|nr:Uma2 family endonuclease [Bacteroidota bacterium]
MAIAETATAIVKKKAEIKNTPRRKLLPLERMFREIGTVQATHKMSKKQFLKFSQKHGDLQMERESDGTVIIMPLVLGGSGKREAKIIAYLGMWQMQSEMGEVYGSTTGFDLPDGSTRAPDAAWISDERLADMSPEEEENNFIPVVPDFVVELRSSSDRLAKMKNKMKDIWMKNGVRLGWLIDPYKEKVYIYREDGSSDIVEGFSGNILSGEDIMPGFELPLEKLKLKKKKKGK